MSEQPDQPDDLATATPPRGRNDALLIAIGETRMAAKQAADAAGRVEQAVGGLATRVSKLEVDVATLSTQFSARQHDDDRRTSPWTVAAVLVSASALVVTVILALALRAG